MRGEGRALLAVLLAAGTATADPPRGGEAPRIAWQQDYVRAIRTARETGQLIFVCFTLPASFQTPGNDAPVRNAAALRMMPMLDEDPAIVALASEHFLCVHHMTQELRETLPQGPAGPFQFQTTGVPYFLIKDAEGSTVTEGFAPRDENSPIDAATQMRRHVEGLLRRAAAEHGPTLPLDEIERIRGVLAEFRVALDARRYRRARQVLAPLRENPPRPVPWSRPGEPHPIETEIAGAVAAFHAAAAALLEEARRLEGAGDARGAAVLYRRVAEEFDEECPSRPAALEAQARLATPR